MDDQIKSWGTRLFRQVCSFSEIRFMTFSDGLFFPELEQLAKVGIFHVTLRSQVRWNQGSTLIFPTSVLALGDCQIELKHEILRSIFGINFSMREQPSFNLPYSPQVLRQGSC